MAQTFEEYVQNYRKNNRAFFERPWEKHIDPFRIYGNLYYVGDRAVCGHLIDTGDGLVMIDAGFTVTVPMLVDSVYRLGFDPKEIRTIIMTHGHYDHMGAAEYFRRLYGCKLGISRTDAEMIRTREDFELAELSWEATPLFHAPETFDYLFEDGDVYRQGNTEITLIETPGHTPGVMTFFFDAEENGVKKRAGLLGGVGLSATRDYFLAHFDLPGDTPERMIRKAEELKKEHVDIHLGNHPADNGIIEKRERQLKEGGNPFVDETEWERFLSNLQEKIKASMKLDGRSF